MRSFFRKVKKFFRELFEDEGPKPRKTPLPPILIPEPDNEGERDNEDDDKPDDGGIPDYEFPEGEKKLVYPKAIWYGEKMRTRGYYDDKYPKGAIVHFTAGRSRKRDEGGSRHRDTHELMGEKSVKSAIKKGSFAYFVIDRDGGVHQAFSLDRWGYHAGKSKWDGLGSNVSDEVVGIEIQCAGKVKPQGDGTYHAYFTNLEKGDLPFQEDEVRHAEEDNDNIQKGTYHKYSDAQEKALLELLLWLKRNNPKVFSLDYVLGHDEVAGPKGIGYKRKNDPGASLRTNMTSFREILEKQYRKRYNT